MILPAAAWRERAGLRALEAAVGAADGLVRYVGGAVRDTVLGIPVADVDMATPLRPDDVMTRLRAAGIKAIPTGIAHGTVTAVLPDGPVEVTTLRRDVATDGRHAVVAFTDQWREDAARRDFTINALSADPIAGTVHDHFGGLDDLAAGLVRFIGDPGQRIAEDHLRILRFFRFHARFGRGEPDDAALAACAARANDLMALSRERIAQEMLKLLAAPDPVPAVSLMIDHGIFAPVIPEIDGDGVRDLARLVTREAGGGEPLRRLAALLPADPARAEAVAVRLRLSIAQRRRIALAADAEIDGAVRALAYRIGVEGARDRLMLHAPDSVLAPALAEIDGWQPPRLPIGGGALVAMGLTEGPAVAATLKAIERQWIDEGFPDAERVQALARTAVDQALARR